MKKQTQNPALAWPRRRLLRGAATVLGLILLSAAVVPAAIAASYTRISGNGSSWAGNAVNQWVTDVKAQGATVDFTPDGSSSGRKNFATGISDFAISEIPYRGDTSDPQDTNFPDFSYSMLPVVAGGTSFMYNLNVGGKRFDKLKLSQDALARIFSGQVTQWNDSVIAATNPGVSLPAQRITVVVRSDGSGATAQFTLWMKRQFPQHYAALCAKTGCNPNAATSYYPYQGLSNFTAQSGSNGVTTYTTNTPYTINYDEYSYALGVQFPVAQVQNKAGFFTVPTDSAVAVALTQADINKDPSSPNYLSQDLSRVYAYGDPRTYPISAYSYMLAPSQVHGNFDKAKGAALANFATYSLCEGQRTMGSLGYSPLPMNLVLDAMNQVRKIPGVDAETSAKLEATISGANAGSANPCNNPTFKPGDSIKENQLVRTAPFPAGCDASCQAGWAGAAAATSNGSGSSNASASAAAQGAGASAAAGADAAADATAAAPDGTSDGATTCDADTGVCATGATTKTAAGSGGAVTAAPIVLAGQVGWSSPQSLLIVAALVMFGLVLAPPLTARMIAQRKTKANGS